MHTIYGPPGCGKTTRLAEIVKSKVAEGKSVTVCSYTKTAAVEIATRAGKSPLVSTGTIHSLCFRAAGLHRDMVMSNTDNRKVCSMMGIDFAGCGENVADGRALGDEYLSIQQMAAATGDTEMAEYLKSAKPGSPAQFMAFCKTYADYKSEFGLIDFSDMLWRGIESIDIITTDVLIVDEAQDLSMLQWRFVDAFKASEKFIAGDDDQALFAWAGADSGRMGRDGSFEVLTQSYRVPKAVHRVAERITRKIKCRKEKEYLPRPEAGVYNIITLNEAIRNTKHGDEVMILFRTNKQSAEVGGMLIDRTLPWAGGDSILESRWAAAARAWEDLRKAYEKNNAVVLGNKITNLLTRTLSQRTLMALAGSDNTILNKKWWEVIHAPVVTLRYLMAIEKGYGSLNVEPTIVLSTIHAAKGKESDRVILVNSMGSDKVVDGFRRDPDSEYRVFYVGVTRAKRQLDVVVGHNPISF